MAAATITLGQSVFQTQPLPYSPMVPQTMSSLSSYGLSRQNPPWHSGERCVCVRVGTSMCLCVCACARARACVGGAACTSYRLTIKDPPDNSIADLSFTLATRIKIISHVTQGTIWYLTLATLTDALSRPSLAVELWCRIRVVGMCFRFRVGVWKHYTWD